MLISLMVFPIYSCAIWLGARFFTERGHRIYRNAALFSLAVIGVTTMALTIQDYMIG